jgi:diguanylate cyclase (GGDEF)-like protein
VISGDARGLVLVIDDETVNIEILAAALEQECEVIFATSGAQGIELATSSQPDLILLDVLMPEMDGYAVFAHLKAVPATAAIPVIFVTGRNDSAAEVYGLELGAADYISKPLSTQVVRVRVRNQLELKRARDDLFRRAVTDGLTGLPNRRRFDETLLQEFHRLTRNAGWLSIVILDVDFFKLFNDHYGHILGDECLHRIGAVLREATKRAADLPARFGGEEFALILPDTDLAGAIRVAETVREGVLRLEIDHIRSTVAPQVTVSIGVGAAICKAGETPLSILARADMQLYAAKAAGRNRIVPANAG